MQRFVLAKHIDHFGKQIPELSPPLLAPGHGRPLRPDHLSDPFDHCITFSKGSHGQRGGGVLRLRDEKGDAGMGFQQELELLLDREARAVPFLVEELHDGAVL